MRWPDVFRFVRRSLLSQLRRTFLTSLAIGIGVGAVVLLTSIGEGAYRFVLSEFTQFGTHLIGITPGKTTTAGVPTAMFGTVRPLSLEDADALRRVPDVEAVVPVVQGNAEVESARRKRRTTVLGVGPDVPEVWRFGVSAGKFLSRSSDARTARSTAVLGEKLRRELFGDRNPLGGRVRVGGQPYRVVGVVEPKGQLLGFDLDDAIYVPAARALELFDREGVMEIDILYAAGARVDSVVASVERTLAARHGRVDFTITTQEQMLGLLSKVLGILTLAVGALGGVSLLVGAIGILTMMTIAATERTSEVGLLRAIGARRRETFQVFLVEAAAIAALGGLGGLVFGVAGTQLLRWVVPALPVSVSWTYAFLAESVAILVGLTAGALPAIRAARLDPVEALRSE